MLYVKTKTAIDEVISSLPPEFRGSDLVSTCWVVGYTTVSSHPTGSTSTKQKMELTQHVKVRKLVLATGP